MAVAVQVGWRLAHPEVPIFEAIGIAALLNLAFNGICLWLLTPYRHGDVNMASAWECSRNDVFEGFAVLLAAVGVWLFDAGWPDRSEERSVGKECGVCVDLGGRRIIKK